MSLIQIEQLTKSFGAQVLFSPFSAQVALGDRIALIGDNGVGKSTLLSIIAGLEEPSGGGIHRARGARIGYLPQVARLKGGGTLYQAMRKPFFELIAAEEELRRLEGRMAKTSDPAILHRYDELLQAFERGGGYAIDAKIRLVLVGVGFTVEEFDKPVELLSGGEEARAALARVLLEEPDLLLFDEPTNHLDFAALDWLEETLVNFAGAVILVSHDRHLLDWVTNRTWEIAFGEFTSYPGGYTRSRALREAETARRLELYERQQVYIARQKEFIRRHHAGQKHRQAKDRERKLARIEKELAERPRKAKRISLAIPTGVPSGKRVLKLEGLQVGFSSPLFTCPDLFLYRGERVAIIGSNGCGKTTFLKTITGEVPSFSGRIELGHGVRIATYSQTQEALHGRGTVLDAILSRCDLSIGQVRGFLGRFLFTGKEVKKRMNALSGGERSRVALALLSLMEGNLLLLDEPTNHLDLLSQEILEEALHSYEGTILLVSHDRALLEAIATKVWEIRDGTLRVFSCSYCDYRERLSAERASLQPVGLKAKKRLKRSPSAEKKCDRYQEKKRTEAVKRLEGEIEHLEEELKGLEAQIHAASTCGDGEKIAGLGEVYKRLTHALDERYAKWERLSAGDATEALKDRGTLRECSMSMIKDNVKVILSELPPGITLVAAAKARTPQEILQAIEAGITIIGENYVQEAQAAITAIGERARAKWHLIGHLQRNKVKKAVGLFDMIETVDSLRLAQAIDKACGRIGRTMPILIEINSGREPQKAGVLPEEAEELVREMMPLEHMRVMGLMTMGPRFGDPEKARPYFKETKHLFDKFKSFPNVEMRYLSMGMSNTYQIALEEGANMVRIGTKLFGERAPI